MTTRSERRFEKADVLRMFLTFVWKGQLDHEVCEPLNQSILRSLRAIGAPLADLRQGESWQSDHGLHDLGAFRQLIDCVNEAAASVLAYLKVGNGGFTITGCWANVSAPGAGHGRTAIRTTT